MEWLESIRKTIGYVEKHLLEIKNAEEIESEVHMSSFYLQKGFKLMTGYTIAEYIRSRRLYLAALEVIAGRDKVIDIAYKYGYDTPESFTKAFSRFHGVTPTQIRNHSEKIKVFLPLKISIEIRGGNDMDYVVEEVKSFKIIGFARDFSFDNSYQEIPKFWDEICQKNICPLMKREFKPENLLEETICNCHIGDYGVCINDAAPAGKFRYFIAGAYMGGAVPEGMEVYKIPEGKWAKFSCKGPMPEALQTVNTKIFKEWFPGNPEYEIAMPINIEWYSREGDTQDADYESAVWVPVKKKV